MKILGHVHLFQLQNILIIYCKHQKHNQMEAERASGSGQVESEDLKVSLLELDT